MTTHYLVATNRGSSITELKVMPEGVSVATEARMWALRDGDQVMYVYNKMQGDLKNFYLHGTYQNGAVYGLEFDDMMKLITARLGADDKTRYEQLMDLSKHNRIVQQEGKWELISVFLGGVFDLLLAIIMGCLKIFGFLIGGLLLMRWMGKGK